MVATRVPAPPVLGAGVEPRPPNKGVDEENVPRDGAVPPKLKAGNVEPVPADGVAGVAEPKSELLPKRPLVPPAVLAAGVAEPNNPPP